MTSLLVDAALEFSVSADSRQMAGTLRGSGSDLELRVSDPRLLGGSGTGAARVLAEQLAAHGVRLSVTAGRPLVTLGAVRTPWWQRRVTGSPHIRVASLAAALRLARLRRTSARARVLVPPPTPLPLLPTFLRRPRVAATTHDPDGGGYPRLVVAPDAHPLPGRRQPVFHLGSLTTIGSGQDTDVVLAGTEALHAEVRRTLDDEFLLVPLVRDGSVRVNGAPLTGEALLRTGTRVDVAGWTLSYYREEYADHGRPYGGRIGGELGRQRPQPPREALTRPGPH